MHLPLINIKFPGNSLKFFEIIIPIVNYDLLDDVKWYNDFIVRASRRLGGESFDEEYDSNIPLQWDKLGYDSRNPFVIQGTLTIVLF